MESAQSNEHIALPGYRFVHRLLLPPGLWRSRETAEMKRDLEQEVEELREQKAALIDEIAYKPFLLFPALAFFYSFFIYFHLSLSAAVQPAVD